MNLKKRNYQNSEDYWRLREFLRRVMLLNGRRELSWHVARLDYWIWFANADLEKISLEEQVFFWETEDGQLAACLNPEERGIAFLQVDPTFRSPQLLEEMVATAEAHLSITHDGQRRLNIYLDSQDQLTQQVLARRGFQPNNRPEWTETQHRRSLDAPLPPVPPTPGYTLRPLEGGLELLERCYASGLGFHADDIHTARDNRDHPEWYHHIQSAPLYRRDLDLVAVALDGSIASFCTIWLDDVTRTAYFEPVATVPAHQRKGLGTAVILAGLHRLQHMGCQVAFIGGYSQAANALYFSVMGPEHDLSEPWEKIA